MLKNQLIEIRPGRKISVDTNESNSEQMILFIHGAGGRGAQWHNQVESFKYDYFVVVPDMVGHGESPEVQSGYKFIDLATDLEELFEKFKRRRNIIIGHSYGTAFALWLAGKNNQEIRRAVLIGAAPFRTPNTNSVWKLPVFILRLLRPKLSENFAAGAFHPDTDPEFIERERAVSDSNSLAMMKKLFNGMRFEGKKDIRLVNMPVMVINGEADKFTTVEMGKSLTKELPDARFIKLAGAAHLAMMEKPVELNRLIRDFIEPAKKE